MPCSSGVEVSQPPVGQRGAGVEVGASVGVDLGGEVGVEAFADIWEGLGLAQPAITHPAANNRQQQNRLFISMRLLGSITLGDRHTDLLARLNGLSITILG